MTSIKNSLDQCRTNAADSVRQFISRGCNYVVASTNEIALSVRLSGTVGFFFILLFLLVFYSVFVFVLYYVLPEWRNKQL